MEIISVKFICTDEICRNFNIEYYWADLSETSAQCGGCGIMLEAVVEYGEVNGS